MDKKIYNKIKQLLEGTEFLKSCISADELAEVYENPELDLNNYIYGTTHVSYEEAINFLKKYDPSLACSIQSAKELGYELKDLNTMKLANCLLWKQAKIELGELLNNKV